jgi:hypothetical protein
MHPTRSGGPLKACLVRLTAVLATMGTASMGSVASAMSSHGVKLLSHNEAHRATAPAESAAGTFSIPSNLVERVENVPVSDLISQAVAAYKTAGLTSNIRPPEKLAAKTPFLVRNGKPEIIFLGAEFCPYCAPERWSLVMALSKFGTFSHLVGTTSSSTDLDPASPSFSFYGPSFSSPELVFLGDEMFNNHGMSSTGFPVLQKPTAEEQALFTKYDAPPYVPATDSGGIPFTYIAGSFVLIGPQWLGAQLSGLSWASAATTLTSGTTLMSKEAEAAAGFLVGDICAVTHDKPISVCSQVPRILLGVSTSTPGP